MFASRLFGLLSDTDTTDHKLCCIILLREGFVCSTLDLHDGVVVINDDHLTNSSIICWTPSIAAALQRRLVGCSCTAMCQRGVSCRRISIPRSALQLRPCPGLWGWGLWRRWQWLQSEPQPLPACSLYCCCCWWWLWPAAAVCPHGLWCHQYSRYVCSALVCLVKSANLAVFAQLWSLLPFPPV